MRRGRGPAVLEMNALQSKPKRPKKRFDVSADRGGEHDLYSVSSSYHNYQNPLYECFDHASLLT